jgi:hypothetical protein
MSVRAKLTVTAVTEHDNKGHGKTIELMCVYDPTIPEDYRFCEATPNGQVKLYITNPAALDQFKIGKAFYLDFTPAE